ncbi:MAG: hypothetical protein QM626_07800 [Microbacterium sp.]|uniref:hypothetical protein n=1 Tax=Microbacterium sp. TaxID=51671 RepID=UPI0039E4F728
MFDDSCFACRHVLNRFRPVLYVCRDHGDWIFTCGEGDHGGIEDWARVHARHLLDADASLGVLAELGPRDRVARCSARSEWLVLPG